jgi:tRNA(Ile)-lysidine synthase
VSGGVDSMVLLHLILAIHDHSRIIVAHYNHHLRGIDSDEDAHFVAEFCKKNNLDFRLGE